MTTKDVFIEVTARDRTKGSIVLNTVVTTFSQYCAKPFRCERKREGQGDLRTKGGGGSHHVVHERGSPSINLPSFHLLSDYSMDSVF